MVTLSVHWNLPTRPLCPTAIYERGHMSLHRADSFEGPDFPIGDRRVERAVLRQAGVDEAKVAPRPFVGE